MDNDYIQDENFFSKFYDYWIINDVLLKGEIRHPNGCIINNNTIK